MKIRGRKFKIVVKDDLKDDLWGEPLASEEGVRNRQVAFNRFWNKILNRMEEPMKHTKVYEVWAFCGENPDNITTIPSGSPFTFADDEAEAILKSRICESIASYNVSFKFVTIIANEIGQIKVNK